MASLLPAREVISCSLLGVRQRVQCSLISDTLFDIDQVNLDSSSSVGI